jgi:hypothetical protein
MASKTYGGKMRILIGGVEMLNLQGSLTTDLSAYEYTSAPNANGTMDRTAAFTGVTFEFDAKENDGNVDWEVLMSASNLDIQFVLETERALLSYLGAALTGKPKRDDFTGIISGLQGHAATGKRVAL